MLNTTIYEDGNGGQLAIRNNDIATTNSLFMIAYISMFGGNREASTKPLSDSQELNYDWWGNDKNEQSSNWINSETERTLTGISLNSQSIERIKQAVKTDVDILKEYGELNVDVNIISINRVKITITLNQSDNLSIIWDVSNNEIISELWL
jgi:hypothetical protein